MSSTAIYLYIGADQTRGDGTWPNLDSLGGHIGVMAWIASFAPIVDAFYARDKREYPGVAHYEVTEAMGTWLYQNSDATPEEFEVELTRFVNGWIAEYEPRPSDSRLSAMSNDTAAEMCGAT
ncbi:hypothetical protein Rfer_4373 (plasmid) [Rhodoferax ferrireducens T118]|uniref:Uncharacterized protein n=1 Tax=Albidiferax ferrireducens (strain ATCC BAA-621 / DSM 15236 / T118) TaxID=338969 RepID=Q21Q86_ALBFT|nr:hypothetical protein [Rhodoferax ferrireducens]ABD72059.1 hypothetical protein Rfer_4373 [Rhodoferax ferrireducens T118]